MVAKALQQSKTIVFACLDFGGVARMSRDVLSRNNGRTSPPSVQRFLGASLDIYLRTEMRCRLMLMMLYSVVMLTNA